MAGGVWEGNVKRYGRPISCALLAVVVTSVSPAASARPPRPTLTSLAPASAAATAGASVTLRGHHLRHVRAVYFGHSRVHFRVLSSSRLRVTAPRTQSSRSFAVRVAAGGHKSNARTFHLVDRPRVATFSPRVANSVGGTRVVVRGTDFRSVRSVTFDGVKAASVQVLSPSLLSAIAPAHPVTSVPVEVHVRTAYGTSSWRDTFDRLDYKLPPTPERIYPTDSPVAGGRQVEISGIGVASVRSVRIGGVPARIVAGGQNGNWVRVLTPAHAAGLFDVVVQTDVATSVPTPAAQVRYGRENPLTWSPSETIDPDRGLVQDLACSRSVCASADNNGSIYADDGSGWAEVLSAPGHRWESILCDGNEFCVASDGGGWQTHFAEGRWSDPAPLLPDPLSALSCPSASQCRAVTRNGGEAAWNGSDWTVVGTSGPPGAVALTCTDDRQCVAAGADGTTAVRSAQGWSPGPVLEGGVVNAIACRSGGCRAARSGDWFQLDDGAAAWRRIAAGPAPRGAVGRNLSCPTSTQCTVLTRTADGSNALASLTGDTWASSVRTGLAARLVSCVATRTCVTYGEDDRVHTFDGSTLSEGELVDARRGNLVDVSCSSKAFCAAVDSNGNALTRGADQAWSPPQRISGSLAAISCPADGYCVAVNAYQAFTLQDGRWSPFVPIDSSRVTDISCASVAFCVAVDIDGHAAVRYDTTWTTPYTIVPASTRNKSLRSISCQTAGECSALVDTTSMVTMENGRWTPPTAILRPYEGRGLVSLACAAAGFCMASANDGTLARIDHGNIATTAHVLPPGVAHVECATTTNCVAAGDTRSAHWNGTTWSASATSASLAVSGVSCTETRCTAISRNAATTTALPSLNR